MIRVLFDTDHVSLHERGHVPLRARLASFAAGEIAVSAVTVEEMLRGRLAVLARRSEGERRVHAYEKLLETVRFFTIIPVVPFDMACERQFQDLRCAVQRRHSSAGANPARQLSLQPVAIGAVDGGNDID